MLKIALSFLASGLVLSASTAAMAKPRPTPKELAEKVVAKKRTELPALRIVDELNWYGFRLLDPAPDAKGIDTDRGTVKQFLQGSGVWDDVYVESANGKIVGLTFVKSLDSLYEADAFQSSLRDHIASRLGAPRSTTIGAKGHSWSLKTETEFLDDWRNYASWKIAMAQDPGNPLADVIHNEPPVPSRVVEQLSNVSIQRPSSQVLMLHVSTLARGIAMKQERERKKADFGRQLEETGLTVSDDR